MRANMIIEKGATDRRLVHIFIDYKSNRLVLQTGRLFLCLVIIFAECVSGTKAGNAEAHNCNKVHNTHWLSPPFQWIPLQDSMKSEGHSPSVEGLTAYRYGSTHVLSITVSSRRCNIK